MIYYELITFLLQGCEGVCDGVVYGEGVGREWPPPAPGHQTGAGMRLLEDSILEEVSKLFSLCFLPSYFLFCFSIHLITILRSVSGLELSPLRAACCQASCFLHRRTLTSSGDLLQQKCHSAIVWTEKSVSHSGLPSSLDCGSEPILPAFLRRLYTTLCLKVIHIQYTTVLHKWVTIL